MTTLNPNIKNDLRKMARHNTHVHTIYSPCAAPEMTPAAIVAAADRLGLKSLTLTDHHSPGESDRQLAMLQENLHASLNHLNGHAVTIHTGAELSAYGHGLFAEDWDVSSKITYRLYACNHYHLRGWEHPHHPSLQNYKAHMLTVARSLIASGRANCLAHPLVGTYLSRRIEHAETLPDLYDDEELLEIFTLARQYDVAMEINTSHLLKYPAFAYRYITLGFSSGTRMCIGTDAHNLLTLDPRPAIEALIVKIDHLP